MLLEAFAPTPDASEIHSIKIAAPPQAVYRALWTADLGRSPIVKVLLALRSLPTLFSTRAKGSSGRKLTLQALIDAGFGCLAEEPEREIVLGTSGRFWPPNTCYEMTAALTVPDSTHFRVDIDATGLLGPYAVCFDVSMSVPYVARFAATRPGRYEVEVFHRIDGRTRIRVSKLLTL